MEYQDASRPSATAAASLHTPFHSPIAPFASLSLHHSIHSHLTLHSAMHSSLPSSGFHANAPIPFPVPVHSAPPSFQPFPFSSSSSFCFPPVSASSRSPRFLAHYSLLHSLLYRLQLLRHQIVDLFDCLSSSTAAPSLTPGSPLHTRKVALDSSVSQLKTLLSQWAAISESLERPVKIPSNQRITWMHLRNFNQYPIATTQDTNTSQSIASDIFDSISPECRDQLFSLVPECEELFHTLTDYSKAKILQKLFDSSMNMNHPASVAHEPNEAEQSDKKRRISSVSGDDCLGSPVWSSELIRPCYYAELPIMWNAILIALGSLAPALQPSGAVSHGPLQPPSVGNSSLRVLMRKVYSDSVGRRFRCSMQDSPPISSQPGAPHCFFEGISFEIAQFMRIFVKFDRLALHASQAAAELPLTVSQVYVSGWTESGAGFSPDLDSPPAHYLSVYPLFRHFHSEFNAAKQFFQPNLWIFLFYLASFALLPHSNCSACGKRAIKTDDIQSAEPGSNAHSAPVIRSFVSVLPAFVQLPSQAALIKPAAAALPLSRSSTGSASRPQPVSTQVQLQEFQQFYPSKDCLSKGVYHLDCAIAWAAGVKTGSASLSQAQGQGQAQAMPPH
jgi:hypothetical protein